MLKVSIRKINPGQEGRLRDWLGELMRRKDEVRATFKQESVRHEQAFLLPTADGAALLYVVEAEDLEQASEAYQNSTLPIDMEYMQVMKQVLGDSVPLELLYDFTLEKRPGDLK